MGAQIAAHLANAGLPVVLLDVTAEAAKAGLDRARALKPNPFFVPDAVTLIRTAGFDDLALVSDTDWVIEAVVEQLDAKRALLDRLEPHLSPTAVVTSNTSGMSLAAIAEGRTDRFRRRWLGTHFFNPPRYLRLVELIPTSDTDPAVVAALGDFIARRLGKGIVLAKDTPAFIANRLGIFGAARALDAVASGGYTIEEVDAVSGPVTGRPKSATFRTLDLAGLDVLSFVARDLQKRLPSYDAAHFQLPPIVDGMLERHYLGAKTGKGFYTRVTVGDESRIQTIDLETFEFRDAKPARLPSLEAAMAIADIGERLRTLVLGSDRAGALLRATLGQTLVYAANVAQDIASSIDDIDAAMRWGFGWELGPFEMWDAIGPDALVSAMEITVVPRAVWQMIPAGQHRFRDAPRPGADRRIVSPASTSRLVRSNAGASLVDLGDGVLCVEFHSKMNTIGGDTIEMLHAGVREAERDFAALVIGNLADQFSAGANLMLVLLEAQEGNWDEVDAMVRAFQSATMALKLAGVPVVVAPAGLTLGGGCEICLHGDRVQAAAESYIGLVEVGVGLIPAGGGTKEMLLRSPHVQTAFETIGFGKTSTSAADARRLGYLRDVDGVTMNRDALLADAKAVARARADQGYRPPVARTAVPVGGADTFATLSLGVHLAWRAGRITDHDATIGRKLAWVLSGGNAPHATTLSESQLLDLEREAFLSLCGERKTLERIGYTLKTGKTLRN